MENKETNSNDSSGKILLKPYSLTDLAKIYKVNPRTLQKWINEFKDELGQKVGRFYSIKQVKIIFNNLNLPHTTQIDNFDM